MKISKTGYDWPTITISLCLLAVMILFTIACPVETTNALVAAKTFVCSSFGSLFELVVVSCLVLCAFLAFSKYGSIRLGEEAPEYSTFSWISMIFCATMGAGFVYWTVLEWVYYVQAPPFGYAAMSQEAFEIALPYSLFHWGFPSWSVNALGGAVLAYRHYVRKKEGFTLQNACEGVLGERSGGWLSIALNVLFVFSVLGGLTVSYGTSMSMLTNNFANIFGTEEGFVPTVCMILSLTAVFTASTARGLQKGMRLISDLTVYLCLILCALFFLLGDPRFALENTVQSLGIMVEKFPRMLTYTDPIGKSGFPQDWTVFILVWGMSLAPQMWSFIAKVSRGRTLRSLLITVLCSGFAGVVMFFGTITNYGISAQLTGKIDVVAAMARNPTQLISDLILSLPFGMPVLVLFFLTSYLLMATTMDSASYSLAAVTTRNLAQNTDPKRWLRISWAALIAVPAVCLLYAGQFIEGGAPLSGLQSLLIVVGVPIAVTVVFTMISGLKWIRRDFGAFSREDILRRFDKSQSPAINEMLQ